MYVLQPKLQAQQSHNKYDADGLCVVEGGTDWFQASEDKKASALFYPTGRGRIIAAHNKHESFGRCQHGRTALVAASRLSGFIIDKGANSTGLGWFFWIGVGSGERKTWIVSAYQPCRSSTTTT